MSNLTDNIARMERHLKKLHSGASIAGPITNLWKMYHEALEHASTPLEYNAIQSWGLSDLVEFVGHQRHNSDDSKQIKIPIDEEINLYIEAKKLGIRVTTLHQWQKIKSLLEPGMTHKAIAERLAMQPDTLKDNLKKMRVKGYINR